MVQDYDWKFEKDAYGDDSWDMVKDGFYYELRQYPTPLSDGSWALLLVKYDSPGLFSKKISSRKIFVGQRDEVKEYAKKYVNKSISVKSYKRSK